MLTKQERDRQYYIRNRKRIQERSRIYSKTKRYGITREQWHQLWLEQEGLCALCKHELDRTPDVDHDHNCCSGNKACGRCVRGLLHPRCNRIIVGSIESIGVAKVLGYLGVAS